METVIGLEIHAQLATRTKIFSARSRLRSEPNTQLISSTSVTPILPVLTASRTHGVQFASRSARRSAGPRCFARKNYFYPDLPQGYQISQYELPIVSTGTST